MPTNPKLMPRFYEVKLSGDTVRMLVAETKHRGGHPENTIAEIVKERYEGRSIDEFREAAG